MYRSRLRHFGKKSSRIGEIKKQGTVRESREVSGI